MVAARKVVAKVKKLREEALLLTGSGKFAEALSLYEQLTALEPLEGEWPRRAADCCWHLKDPKKRLKHSINAAKAYSEAGLLLKAIAMCKVSLSIDPTHKESQAQLAQLHARRPRVHSAERPQGVRRIGSLPQDAARAVRIAQAKLEADGGQSKAQQTRARRMRARMAAAAALRRARAEDSLRSPEPRAPQAPAKARAHVERVVEAASPAPKLRENPVRGGAEVLGRIALKPRVQAIDIRKVQPRDPPPPSDSEPPIPSLRLPTPSNAPHPPLADLILSDRVQSEARPSLHPQMGNIYSLTLSKIPSAHLQAARLPQLSFRQDNALPIELVPVIDPVSEPPRPPPSEPQPDSVEEALAQQHFDRLTLEQTPIFSQLDPQLLEYLIDVIGVVELEAHEVLFNEGDTADAMYVIVEGSVVAMTAPKGDRPIELARLEEGEFFGEIGLLSDQPRQASVSAAEPTRLLRFDRSTVGFMVDQAPEFLSILLDFLKRRLVEDLMMTSPLFAPFDPGERAALGEQFEFFEIDANSVLLDHGQRPIGMYVLLTGSALMASATGGPGALRRLRPGDIFGEQALLNNEPSRIQVRTTSKCFALCLPSDAFVEVIMTHPTVLEYLANLRPHDVLHVTPDFLDHISFF